MNVNSCCLFREETSDGEKRKRLISEQRSMFRCYRVVAFTVRAILRKRLTNGQDRQMISCIKQLA
jgi:hypothetical protein